MSKPKLDHDLSVRLARIEKKVDNLVDQHFFEYTGTSEKNWSTALSMARELTKGWTACDTTSGENKPSFESEVQRALGRGCRYLRIYCGNPVNEASQEPDRAWISLMSVIHPGSDDGYNNTMRKAILRGRLQILHLNRPLEMDLFTVRHSSQQARALIGFATRHGVFDSQGYTSGLHSWNPAFANDLHDHFLQVLWNRALDHVREERIRKESGKQYYCRCVDFFDKSLQSLSPRGGVP